MIGPMLFVGDSNYSKLAAHLYRDLGQTVNNADDPISFTGVSATYSPDTAASVWSSGAPQNIVMPQSGLWLMAGQMTRSNSGSDPRGPHLVHAGNVVARHLTTVIDGNQISGSFAGVVNAGANDTAQ